MQLEGSHPRGVTARSPNLNAEPMLYKSLIAAFVVSSGDALRIDGLSGRRSVVTSAAAAASLVPLAAFAELKKAGDAEIYKRADEGKLNAARVSTATSSRSIGPIDPPKRIARLRLPLPCSLDLLHVHRRSSAPRPATSSTARRPAAASSTS